MPSETVIALRKQLREKFPAAHRSADGARDSSHTPACPPKPRPRREPILTGRVAPAAPPHPSSPSPPPSRGEAAAPFSIAPRHFPPGTLNEASPADPACGLPLLVAALLAEDDADPATPSPEFRGPTADLPLVLIDARDRFDPGSFSAEDCRRLLWLRCRETRQALQAADLLLRDGNLPFVVLDLSALPPRELRRIPRSSWHRLRQLAEGTRTTLLALTPTPLVPGTARRLLLTRRLQLTDLDQSRPELLRSLTTETTRHRLSA